MDYVDQLVEGICAEASIDKFDALMSIVTGRVAHSYEAQTCEDLERLQRNVVKAFRALFSPSFTTYGEYNNPADISKLTDVQRAYLCGEFAAMCNVVGTFYRVRPSKETLAIAMDNKDLLADIFTNYTVYDKDKHQNIVDANLAYTVRHGVDLIVQLTPFGKQIIQV